MEFFAWLIEFQEKEVLSQKIQKKRATAYE